MRDNTSGHLFSQKGDSYAGEHYVPELSGKDFSDHRTREKGYSMIAAILHVVIGLLPALALSFPATAGCYLFGLVLVIWMTLRNYRAPSEATPLTRQEYSRYVTQTKLMCNIQRILLILGLLFNIVYSYLYQLGMSPWFILQLVLLLLEALDLQFLYRLQRGLHWETEA